MNESPPVQRRVPRVAVVGMIVVFAGACAAIWFAERDRVFPAKPDDAAGNGAIHLASYVGSQSCARCHEAIHKAYQSHPMSQSMSVVADDRFSIESSGSDSLFLPGGKCEYEVARGQGRVIHHEKMRDSAGELIFDQGVEVHYSVGSGTRGRSYISDRGGIMFMSPISWYSQAATWDLSPGYVPDDPLRFERRVIDDCLACHVGRMASLPQSDNRFRKQPFHELSIGCENCHGPGKEHVEYHDSPRSRPATGDPIVNPARLDVECRESVCYQCHLQGAARILRAGRRPYDFRPGQRLEDFVTTMLDGSSVGEQGQTRSVSQVQQMKESACYRASPGRLGCTSCHDPHSSPGKAERIEFYRERCLNCHQQQPCAMPEPVRRSVEAEDSCIDCHMPRFSARDVVHTSQTDHRVPRKPELQTRSPDSSPAGDWTFFDGADTRLESWEVDRVRGLAAHRQFMKTGDQSRLADARRLLTPVADRVNDDIPVLVCLASIALAQNRFDDAKEHYQRVLRLRPGDEDALQGLVQAGFRTGDYQGALQAADQLLGVNPWLPDLHGARAQMLKVMGRLPEAIAAGEQAVKLNPRQITIHSWLAEACRAAGDAEASERHQAAVLRLQSARRRSRNNAAND